MEYDYKVCVAYDFRFELTCSVDTFIHGTGVDATETTKLWASHSYLEETSAAEQSIKMDATEERLALITDGAG